jgi:hypothetical protein
VPTTATSAPATKAPSKLPTTKEPTAAPTDSPIIQPVVAPTPQPTAPNPTTLAPTKTVSVSVLLENECKQIENFWDEYNRSVTNEINCSESALHWPSAAQSTSLQTFMVAIDLFNATRTIMKSNMQRQVEKITQNLTPNDKKQFIASLELITESEREVESRVLQEIQKITRSFEDTVTTSNQWFIISSLSFFFILTFAVIRCLWRAHQSQRTGRATNRQSCLSW